MGRGFVLKKDDRGFFAAHYRKKMLQCFLAPQHFFQSIS